MLNLFQHNEQPSPVILKQPVVMLNLVQHNEPPSPVILKQVQDDEGGGGGGGRWGETMTRGMDDDGKNGANRLPGQRSRSLPDSRVQKRPEPSRVRAMSWMFAGGTSGGGGAYEERRERPAAKL
jgi:hypothetical protein